MFDVLVSDMFSIEWWDTCGCYVEMKRGHSGRVKDIHSNFKCDGGIKCHRLPDAWIQPHVQSWSQLHLIRNTQPIAAGLVFNFRLLRYASTTVRRPSL